MKISLRVKTRSSRNGLERNPDGSLTARLRASPVKGEANRALIELLSEEFTVPKGRISIIKGLTSKNKIVSLGK